MENKFDLDETDAINYMDFLENIKRVSPTTVELYLKWYKHLDPKLISQEYVFKFFQKRGNNSVIRGMMKNYLEFRRLNKEIELPPKPTGVKPQRIKRYFTTKEVNDVINFSYDRSFKEGLMVDLVYQGALRGMEIGNIKINSFRWKEFLENYDNPKGNFCELKILGKGKKERIVLINKETATTLFEKLQDYYGSGEHIIILDDKLFMNMNYKKIWDIIKRNSVRALGKDIRPHELRSSRAIELEERGVNIREIKVYLGHSKITTTEIYLRSDERRSIQKIRDIENIKGVEKDGI